MQLTGMAITSSAFESGGRIPVDHTGEGPDTSPALSWSGIPEGTRQLALICHDPDAPLPRGWVHWVLYNIPPDASGLAEGSNGGWTEGVTDFGKQAYGGPMPPPGHGTHHYFFWLYALSEEIDAPAGLTMAQLLDRIEGSVIEQARIVGTYDR